MKKFIFVASLFLVGCSSMPERTCTAKYESGGTVYDVAVFGTRDIGIGIELRAGYPFNYKFTPDRNFKSHNCK